MSIESDAAPLICPVCKSERLDGNEHGQGVCGPWPPVATEDNVVTDDPARMPGCGCHAAREVERLRECLRQIIAVHDGKDAPWDAARYLAQHALLRSHVMHGDPS